MKSVAIRIALAPVILVIAASDFLQLDAARKAHWHGWLAPEMEEHWARLGDPKHPQYGSFGHSAKNILSEWVRLDAQRAGKLFAFLLAWSVAAHLLLLAALWLKT